MERFLFLDTETTGLDHEKHGILTAFFIETKLKRGKLIACPENSLDIKIDHGDNMPSVEQQALKINQINLDTFKGTHTPKEAVRALIELKNEISPFQRLMVGGHNVSFDINFLKALFKQCNQNWDKHFHYHYFDSMHIANGLRWSGRIDSGVSLVDLSSYFNIERMSGQAHEAKFDVIASIEVSNAMLELQREITNIA